MNATLYIQAISAVYSLLLIIVYYSKERLKTIENNIFKILMAVNFVGLIIDLICAVTTYNMSEPTILNYAITKLYLMYFIIWISIFSVYTYAISKNSDERKIKLNLKVNIILLILFFWIVILLPLEFVKGQTGMYAEGFAVNFVYLIVGVYISLCVVYLLKNIRNILDKKYIPLFSFLVLGMVVMYIQKNNPALILIPATETFVTFLMYFTIENPDVKMVKELEMAKNEAEKANHAKSEFLSSMSHELRTPLNAIVCFSELLESKEGLDSESKDFAKDIVSASHNLLDLVNGVLDISKIEAGKMELINKEYNSFELFNSLSTMVIPRIGDKPIDFKTVIASDIPPVLKGDTGKLKQIILNLLTNAVKYTDKGFIKYRVECINDYKNNQTKLIITVTDTGRGIKKEDIDRLFKKFERLEEDRNTSIEGTGLGLAITESLAELMGGKITVISDYGKGSTFKFVVVEEIVNKESNLVVNEQTTLNYETFEGKKVLVVDDSKLNLKVAENVLKSFKVSTETVTSGLECLSCVKSKKYDIIFMDIMMPNMSGVEVLKKLREEKVNIPVIALTADAIEGQEEKYISEGFDGYLSKPIDKTKLKVILNKYLKGE
jgi:signal transduction histidine kinase/CheY-like chemotaxis protein